MSVLVTVVMPAYNASKTIEESIHSVLSQSYKNWQLIIIDDGSKDNTYAIALEFSKMNKRIEVYMQNNNGVASARNAAIIKAEGQLIAFLDSDDIWLPNKLERQVKIFQEDHDKKIGLCYTDIECFTLDVDDKYNCDQKTIISIEDDYLRLLTHDYIATLTVMIREEALEKVGVFDNDLFGTEDWDLWIRISKYFDLYRIEEKLAYYREHEFGISKNKEKHLREKFKVIEKHILKSNQKIPEFVKNEALWIFFRSKAIHLYFQKKYINSAINMTKSISYAPLKVENFTPLYKVIKKVMEKIY